MTPVVLSAKVPGVARADVERRLRNGADDPMTRYYAACAHALRGDTEQALDCLEKAAQRRLRLTVARGRIEASLSSLHAQARFQALVARAAQARSR